MGKGEKGEGLRKEGGEYREAASAAFTLSKEKAATKPVMGGTDLRASYCARMGKAEQTKKENTILAFRKKGSIRGRIDHQSPEESPSSSQEKVRFRFDCKKKKVDGSQQEIERFQDGKERHS